MLTNQGNSRMLKLNVLRASLVISIPIFLAARHAWGEEAPVRVSAGHVMANSASVMTGEFLKHIDQQLPDVEIVYDADSRDSFESDSSRLRKRSTLSDLVFVYCGISSFVDEIATLAQEGRIQAIDSIEGYKDHIKPDDIYPGLRDAGRWRGQVWAVPVRACAPCLLANRDMTLDTSSWSALAKSVTGHRFALALGSDRYALWQSILLQRGFDPLGEKDPSLDVAPYANALKPVRDMIARGNLIATETGLAEVTIANSDLFADMGTPPAHMQVYPFPSEGPGTLDGMCRNWYLAISSDTLGPARAACLRVIAEILSPNTQMMLANLSYSPTVRPSVAASDEFTTAFPESSPVRTMQDALARTRLTSGDAKRGSAVATMDKAVTAAIEDPAAAETILGDAIREARKVLVLE